MDREVSEPKKTSCQLYPVFLWIVRTGASFVVYEGCLYYKSGSPWKRCFLHCRPFCHTFGLESGAALIEEYVPFTGSVFQNPKTQYFNVDTTAELAFPCENMGIPSRDIQKRVRECAEEFGLGKLLNLLNNQGKAILVITHDEELLVDCCDRVVFLHEKEEDSGRIS